MCTLSARSGALGPTGPLVVETGVGVARLGDFFDHARARVDPAPHVGAAAASRRAGRPEGPVGECARVGVAVLRLRFRAQAEVGPAPNLRASAASYLKKKTLKNLIYIVLKVFDT